MTRRAWALVWTLSPPWRTISREQVVPGVPVRAVTRHMLGLFNGLPGARAWRRCLAQSETHDGPELLRFAAGLVGGGAALAA